MQKLLDRNIFTRVIYNLNPFHEIALFTSTIFIILKVKTKEMRNMIELALQWPSEGRDGTSWKESHGKDIRKCGKDIFSGHIIMGTIRHIALAATNAYEYDNVTARKLALAKYTSDSCAWSARTRACMLRAYYGKSGSCHEPVRAFRFYAKVGTVPTRLNPYTSENRVSKPLTGNSCCICEARRG